MQQFALIIHVIISVCLIGLVLIQHGKGADVGASFGSGASQTIFGSQGSGSFLSRATSILAALFLINCLVLGFLSTRQGNQVRDPLLDLPMPTTSQSAGTTAVPTPESKNTIEQQIPGMDDAPTRKNKK